MAALLQPEWELVIECYFDDSGDEAQLSNRFFCVAGYLGLPPAWNTFATHWQQLLLHHDLADVHMKEIKKVQIERNWTDDKRDSVLIDFINVIRGTRLTGFGIAIDVEVWRKLSKERRKTFGSAHEFAFQRILRKVIDRMIKARVFEDLNVVFDQDRTACGPRMNRYFAAIDFDPHSREMLAAISFASAKKCLPLQAADLLAWETRRQLIQDVESKSKKPPNRRFGHLLTPLPGEPLRYEYEGWNAETTEKYLSQMEELVATGKIGDWWSAVLAKRSS